MTEPNRGTMKKRALRAGGWVAAGFGFGQGLRVISTLIMTRLLAPEMFGVMAVASMINAIITLLSDVGIRQNIVQSRRGENPVFLNTAWTVQILRGVLLWLVVVSLAAGLYAAGRGGLLPIGTVYGQPILPWVMVATAFSSVISGFNTTKGAVAQRNFDQRRIVTIEVTAQVSSLLVMLTIGTLTRSIWALVAGQWTGALITLVMGHVTLPGHRNRLAWDPVALREIIAFGKWIFVSSFIGVFALQADRLVLGVLISASLLGQYAIAHTLIATLQHIFRRFYVSVAMPALSETVRNSPERLKSVFYRVRIPTDVPLLLAAGVLAATGDLIIDILYDDRYADAGWMLQILAVSLVWTRYGVDQQLYVALGKPKYIAILNMVRFATSFSGIWIGYSLNGLVGALWGVALYPAVSAAMTYRFNAKLGMNDWGRDLPVLLILPLGYALGYLVKAIA
jgi:O-antigen/teichoic acid export membrane protein